MSQYRLAIIGATGLVGKTFLKILEDNNENFDIKLFASNKSVGKKIKYKNKTYVVHKIEENSFKDVDFALFFTSSAVSKYYVELALKEKVKVIDNSSCFRLVAESKLVAIGANEDVLNVNDYLISNPNCAVIQSIVLLSMLSKYGIKDISYNTYQSVSGSGKQGIDDLLRCRKGDMPLFYETDISFTCIPKIGELLEDGFTEEENKMILETKRLLNNTNINVCATCVRVPVMFSHGVSIEVSLKQDFTVEQVEEIFKENSKVVLCKNITPTSILSCKSDKIYVGRIRKVNDKLLFYCVADNIRVGAASNSYNILKTLIKLGENNK